MNHNPEVPTPTTIDQNSEFATDTPFTHQAMGANVVGRSVGLEALSDSDKLIRELITGSLEGASPDAIFPLSGGIVQRENGNWRTLSGSDLGEHNMVTFGRARVIAGAKIAELFPKAMVVANSFNRFNAEEPTMASVSKNELI